MEANIDMKFREGRRALTLEEHEKIYKLIGKFSEKFDKTMELVEKGFAKNSNVVKKLLSMKKLADFLMYSLQQGANVHASRIGISKDSEDYIKWKRLYLRD
jgi:UDP-N-acetylmuramate-alanine ligase